MAEAERSETTVSVQGQVVLPQSIRDQRRWVAGTRLVVQSTEAGVLLTAAPVFPPTRLDDVFGCLPVPANRKSIDEMDAAVSALVKRHHAGD